MKEINKAQTTLLDFSNFLISAGFPDLFDFSVESDIFTSKTTGSVADCEGNRVIEFTIIKKDGEDNLNTIIEYDINDSALKEV